MADVSKAHKLANARKKFKELKKEKKKNATVKTTETTDSTPTSREQTPVENAAPEASEQQQTDAQWTQLPNYFNGYQNQPPAAFFDNFAPNNETQSESPLANVFTSSSPQNGENLEKDASVSNDHSVDEEVRQINVENNEEAADFQTFDSVKFDENSQQKELSSVESLRQISEQMALLLSQEYQDKTAVFESQLETRNQELADLLNQEKLKSETLESTLNEYKQRFAQLDTERTENQNTILNFDARNIQEMSNLREQLQTHIQTVGILVAEKTELVANVGQLQLSTKQKIEECEELQGRLKTSRSRVADFEREISLLKNEKNHFDDVGREQSSEFEKLKKTHQLSKEERDELMQDLLEVREKLKTSSENNLVFQQQIGELSNQLCLANIKIQQLTTGEIDQASGQVEQLTQEKFALEKQIADITLTVKAISKDREESSLQYQQYAQQLNSQITNMATRLEKLQKENESLQIQEQNRIKHIGELEKQLQNLQNDQLNFALQRTNGDSRAELDAALGLAEKFKTEKTELEERHIKVTNEKEMLMKDLEAKGESIRELEAFLEDLKGNQPDTVKLLAAMESDKVAAARAVAQNTELKNQMDSMQEVFMKLNNDKIELTEALTSEQRSSKELFEKLQKTELHLQTLADAIEIKDKELSHLRDNSLQLDKQMLQSEQLSDRLRHYEAQDHSSHILQKELQEARQYIIQLTAEISNLKQNQKHIETEIKQKNTEEVVTQNGGDTKTEEHEPSDLRRQLDDLQLKNKQLEAKIAEQVIDSNHNDQWTVLDKDAAMKHLEAKFLKTMEDIANLTEEKQRLEHLVLQLQGETETIGEYVALYQYQRSLLKQKAIEKDQQLTQLANDREHMKDKLEKLNELVRKLVMEKGPVPTELLQHHDELNKDHLCEEHAKIHSEINKITNSFTVEPNNCDSQSTETAEQIIALLSEIKSSNLVQPTENFHHCPWCSGQLITV